MEVFCTKIWGSLNFSSFFKHALKLVTVMKCALGILFKRSFNLFFSFCQNFPCFLHENVPLYSHRVLRWATNATTILSVRFILTFNFRFGISTCAKISQFKGTCSLVIKRFIHEFDEINFWHNFFLSFRRRCEIYDNCKKSVLDVRIEKG